MPHPAAILRCRALCASARTANLPSVVCNVWLGAALSQSPTGVFPLLAISGTALYCGGNFLNDWHDREWDAVHRPERALPRGWFPPAAYLIGALVLLVLGVLSASAVGPASGATAALLVISIIGYTVWHKRHAGTVVLMGMCRALLPMLALAPPWLASWQEWDTTGLLLLSCPALALGLYTAGLSLIARSESAPADQPHLRLPVGLLFGAAAIMTIPPLLILPDPAFIAAGLLPFLVWTLHSLPRNVGGLLAGFPWLDAVALIPLGILGWFCTVPASHWLPCLLLPPAAWAAALLLRRFAPAT